LKRVYPPKAYIVAAAFRERIRFKENVLMHYITRKKKNNGKAVNKYKKKEKKKKGKHRG